MIVHLESEQESEQVGLYWNAIWGVALDLPLLTGVGSA